MVVVVVVVVADVFLVVIANSVPSLMTLCDSAVSASVMQCDRQQQQQRQE